MIQLFTAVQQFLYGQTAVEDKNGYFQANATPKQYHTERSEHPLKSHQPASAHIEDLMQRVKDLFYATKKTLYDIFQEGRSGQVIDLGGLKKVIGDYSQGQVADADV